MGRGESVHFGPKTGKERRTEKSMRKALVLLFLFFVEGWRRVRGFCERGEGEFSGMS